MEETETPFSEFLNLLRTGNPCVKVRNIPRDLDTDDVMQVFEILVGRIQFIDVYRDIAFIIFETASLAKQAVDTFDMGMMNGNQIFVTYEQ